MNDTASDLANAMMQYLDCPCQYFAPMVDDAPLIEAFRRAQTEGKEEGFTPVLLSVDETLWECLCMVRYEKNKVNESEDDVDMDQVRQYRQAMLEVPLRDGHGYFATRLADLKEDYELTDEEWDAQIIDEVEGGEAMTSFAGYRDYGSNKSKEVILAKIPTKNPWEIFAWVPFGGWNDCPDTAELMSVAKYWYELYQVAPATISHDVLEMTAHPIEDLETCKKLALEQYLFCTDLVDQGVGTVGALADCLSQSTIWYFWWD